MKKLLLVVVAILLLSALPVNAEEPDVTTAEGLQQVLGIDISTASAINVMGYLDAFEVAYRPYFELRMMCFDRLVELGKESWVKEYQQHEFERPNVMTMSYDDLIVLQRQTNYALWLSDEWEEVEVPAGLYKVGTDIPAGTYDIIAHPFAWVDVDYGDTLKGTGTGISMWGEYDSCYLTGEQHAFYADGARTTWTITLQNGFYISFDQTVYFRKHTTPAFRFN